MQVCDALTWQESTCQVSALEHVVEFGQGAQLLLMVDIAACFLAGEGQKEGVLFVSMGAASPSCIDTLHRRSLMICYLYLVCVQL